VFSIFWRAYATAWMQTADFKNYATTLPADISGVFQHEGSGEAATILQQHWTIHGGVMISLDYSQSYDRMNVQATLDFLQRIHWPPALLSQTRQVWKTKRYLEYDNHVHPQILVSSGVPQGCPIAPLTLATWMSSGATAVQSLMQSEANVTAEAARQAVTRIYMDDRSWIDSNYDRALQRATQWHTWSARVGLRESLEKIQACAKPSRLQDILRQDRPDWTIQDTVKVLGVSLRPKRMANTRLEQGRLHSSLRRAKILSCLPVPYHRKTELYCMFVVPKALYGWIVRFPTKADSNKIFNALSRMTGTNRMANPLIRSIIYGGACHLQILLAIRLFKCLCRMRCRGTAVWTNVPGTPSRKFRDWLKDWGWREISPWNWQRNAHTLRVPEHAEVDAYCHQIRMAWRHELLRK